jgi:hypothetical protein
MRGVDCVQAMGQSGGSKWCLKLAVMIHRSAGLNLFLV